MNDKQIQRKEIAAYTLMTLLILLSGFILYRMDYSRQYRKMQDQNRMKLNFAAEMIQYMDSLQDASDASVEDHQDKTLRFTGLTGNDAEVSDEEARAGSENGTAEERVSYLKSEDFQKVAKQALEGILLLGSAEGQQPDLIWESESASGASAVFDPAFVSKLIKDRPQTVKAAGSHWLCTYSALHSGSVLLYMAPLRSLIMRCLFHIGLAAISELLIFVTVITYFFSVIKYSSTHQLTKQQAEQYQPKKFRRKLMMSGLTGALIIFISTAVLQTMDALHEESIIGAQGISDLFAYVGKSVTKRIEDEKQKEDQWYVDHGKRIASMIARDPGSVSREDLQKYCDRFDIDYIMLFDPKGNEILSSADYVGFTMYEGLGENSADFRRLLRGVPSIVHDVSLDPVTELERQYIGVRLPFRTESGDTEYGALLMAVIPHMKSFEDIDIIGRFYFHDKENRFYFYTDQETGTIIYASDSTLVGKTAMECGLPERSLLEGYTDFAAFNGVNSYVTMIKQPEAMDFFYVIRASELFSSTLPMAVSVLLCYLLSAQLLAWFCLKDYRDGSYEALINDKSRLTAGEHLNGSGNEDLSDYSSLLISKNRSDTRWTDKTPESRVGFILKIDMILLVILPLLVFTKIYGDSSLFWFILNGSWMRSVNLFAFCAITIVIIFAILAVVAFNGILSMIAGFTGRAGETLCRMLYSLIQYMAILNVLYYAFDYVGLSMSTYIASLGAASLALSIGAQGMVADILAGALIVFEHQFQVGDIVEVEGYRGRVLEIGVRSTRLLGSGNEIRFINNSDIRSVVNKSIRNSAYRTEIILLTMKTVEQIEELFNRELPEIGSRSDLIISGPSLNGIVKVSGSIKAGTGIKITLRIMFECAERDRDEVRDFINREIFLFCEREGIVLN